MGVERMNVAQRLGPNRHAGGGHTWIDGCVFSSRIHGLSPGQRSLTKQRHYCIINIIIISPFGCVETPGQMKLSMNLAVGTVSAVSQDCFSSLRN